MKALFIGLGSVGQRHLQNFIELRPENSTVLAYRSSKTDNVIVKAQIVPDQKISEFYNLIEFTDLDKALSQNPDVAFICNPNSLHLKTALKIAENNIHFFIEKPIGVNSFGIKQLEDITNKNNLISMVGYQTRFNPVVIEARNRIASMKYGEVVSASYKWCTFLPDHHTYEDYRNSYAAREDLGGGVIFCLIHELDLIQWFFNYPLSVYAVRGGVSNLELNVEDNIFAIIKCKVENNVFPASLHLSFSQKCEERYFDILLQDGHIRCDLLSNEIIINSNDYANYQKKYEGFSRNDLFKLEMEEFIRAVEYNNKTIIPISEGIKSLNIAIALHQSLRDQGHISLS